MAGYVGTKAVLLSTTAATVGGAASIGGDLTVDTSTLHVDSTNNRVGIGTSSPTGTLDVAQSGSHEVLVRTTSTGDPTINLQADGQNNGKISYSRSGEALIFSNSGSERLRLDSSGNLLVGTTDSTLVGRSNTARLCVDNEDGKDCIQIKGSSSAHLNMASWIPVTGNAYHIGFGSGTSSYTEHGVISTNGSTTTYSTTSDYRLKENVVDLNGATERLKQLRPKRFNFIVNSDTIVDGFLAHEAQAVVPEAVVGTKDAMRDEEYEVTPAVEATYDDDGNELTAAVDAVMGTRSVPVYQGIDQSKLVPLLTAALQEALDEITDLKARVVALEAN